MPVVRNDPCGWTCLLMTYAAVIYADYVIIKWVVLQTMQDSAWGIVNIAVYNSIVLLLFISHSRAVFSDPGIVPLPSHPIDFSDEHQQTSKNKKGNKNSSNTIPSGLMTNQTPPDEDWTICTRCEMYRPPRAHHCRICKRCIRRMDHHCPWINNCVGERNQKYFLQFLFYVGLLAVYSILLVGLSWYFSPLSSNEHGKSASGETYTSASLKVQASRNALFLKQTRILHSVILGLESVLFGLFVFAIGCDQFEAIFTDETLVEQAKKQGPYRPRKPKVALLAEVFGRNQHPIAWLLPFELRRSGTRHIEPSVDYTV